MGHASRAESASRRNRIAPAAARGASVSWPHAGGDPLRRRAGRAGLARRLQRRVAARGVHARRGSLVQGERARSLRRRRAARRNRSRLRADRRPPAARGPRPHVVTVLAEHRRRGVGTALYRSLSAWTREHGIDEIEVPALDDDPESIAFATRRGFVEERRELGVVLELTGMGPPELVAPDGIEIVSWADRPELAHGMYEVSLEAYPDIPGFEDDELESFEDWLAHDMQGSGDYPEATFVAVAGDEVVGYAKFALTAAQPTVAFHDVSGVKRAWRGRGIARALKTAQIRWAIANGFTELRTRNEERNEPIRRLNASLGYRPGIGRVYLVGPLASPIGRPSAFPSE